MTRLYYIVQSEMLTGGVIEAQVIATLRAHNRIAGQPPTRLVFLEPARVAYGRAARETLRRFRELWPEGRISLVPFVSRLGEDGTGRALAAFLLRERFRSSDVVFHCRGPMATWSAHVARRVLGKGRVVFDVRGPAADETIHRLGFPFRENLTPKAELAYERSMAADIRASSVADRIFTVSEGLKRYAVERFGADADRVTVVPSCVESLAFDEAARAGARAEWGVEGDAPVLLYSGRLGRERQPLHMFRVFAAVLRARPDARLVLLSYLNRIEDLDPLLREAGVPASSVVVATYSRDGALARLCGADVGLLFCEPALRYMDWFPIKFPEYLSAGLAVMLNSLVGALPELVERRRVGWVADLDLADERIYELAGRIVTELGTARDAIRDRSLWTCEDLYLWRNYVPAIREAYGVLETCEARG